MIEAVMLWNEPNNLSHWDFEIDPGWQVFSRMVSEAGAAIAAERPGLTRVMGGMSPIDAGFVQTLQQQISLKKNRSRIGAIEEILIEGPSKLRNGQVMGRTRSNRIVNVTGVEQFVGRLVPVRIAGATATSLIGEACSNDRSLNSQQEGDMA